MTSRGTPAAFIGGIFTAAPSGIGVALGITGGGINALVGVAISAALLPPVVNAGICATFAVWFSWHKPDVGLEGVRLGEEWGMMAAYSLGLFLLNFAFIYMFASMMFKVKKIRPLRYYRNGDRNMNDDAGAADFGNNIREPANTTAATTATAGGGVGGVGGAGGGGLGRVDSFCDPSATSRDVRLVTLDNEVAFGGASDTLQSHADYAMMGGSGLGDKPSGEETRDALSHSLLERVAGV
jgi:hypothetical protein